MITNNFFHYKVSAIVSTYANERFIEGCLHDLCRQSIISQLEIIVIDSCSPENEGGIVRRFQKEYPNIVYLRTDERETLYAAWNRAIQISRGQYIINANTDDRLRVDAYEVMAHELDKNPEIALVYADVLVTNTPNQTFENHIRTGCILQPDYSTGMMLDGCYMGPQPMWRKEIHENVGYFDLTYKSAGDYEFWCRIAVKYTMKHITQFLGLYLHNPIGIANSNLKLSIDETRRIVDLYREKLPPSDIKETVSCIYPHEVKDGDFAHVVLLVNKIDSDIYKTLKAFMIGTAFPYVLSLVLPENSQDLKIQAEKLLKEGFIQRILNNSSNNKEVLLRMAASAEPNAKYIMCLDELNWPDTSKWLQIMISVIQKYSDIKALSFNLNKKPSAYFFKSGVSIAAFSIKGAQNVLVLNSTLFSSKEIDKLPGMTLSISKNRLKGLKLILSVIYGLPSYIRLWFVSVPGLWKSRCNAHVSSCQ